MGEKNRKIHIDLLRVLAAFLVLYNHAAGYQYYLNHNNDAVKIITCIVLAVLTKINVPMFFLLSGALLLQKEESYKTLFSKRILRFVLVLIGASALTYGSTHILYQHELSLSWFFRALLSGQISIPYWFLYAYLGFLLSLPFLRKLAKQLNRQDIVMLIWLRVIFSSVMRLQRYIAGYLGYDPLTICSSFTQPFAFADILFYPLVGFYLEHHVQADKFGKKEYAGLTGILALCTAISTAVTYHEGYWGEFSENYLAVFAGISAICVYLLVKGLCCRMEKTRVSMRIGNIAGQISQLTLGIYLLDPVFSGFFVRRIMAPAGDGLLQVPFSVVYCLASMAGCGLITWVLKKLPIMKHLL